MDESQPDSALPAVALLLVVCSLERTHDFDPAPAKSESLALPGIEIFWSRPESSGVIWSHLE